MAAQLARLAPAPAEAVELEEDDEGRAAALFLALGTQWNFAPSGAVQGTGGFGVRVGLKYEVIEPTARLLGIATDAQLMVDLRAMEAEALTVEAEARR